jgi:two-component system, chemotaxis family, chemotaxis protein CheY
MSKILVVDDELDVPSLFLQKFRKEIKNEALEMHFAHNGEDALQFINSHEINEYVILSDINMPGMSGLELVKKIRDLYGKSNPRIMMISAYGDEANQTAAFNLGADDFITKPIDFIQLKGKL